MTYTTERTRRLMLMATNPDGVLANEVDPNDHGEITTAFHRMARSGFGRWEQIAFRVTRFWVTPEQYAAWLETKTPKPKAAPKPRAPKAAKKKAGYQPISLQTWPAARITATSKAGGSSAWWDKNAKPHHDSYVEPRITSETKVTICAPRTPEEWLHGSA